MKKKRMTLIELIQKLFRVNIKKTKDSFGMKGRVRVTKIKNGKKKTGKWSKNTIVSSAGYGKNVVARQLKGDTTYQIEIDTASIGTGSTAPTTADTGLETAVLSNIVPATRDITSSNVVNFRWFITDAELADGTYREFGMFMNGRLFSRALFSSAYIKSTGEDTMVEYEITL